MSKELRFSSDDAQIEIYKNKGAIVAFTVWEGSKMEPAGFYKKQANDFMDSSLQNVSDIPDHDSVEQITHARLQLFHVNGKVTEMEITRKNERVSDLNDVEQRPVFLQQTNVMVEESALSNFANRPQTRAPSGFSRSGRGELNRG